MHWWLRGRRERLPLLKLRYYHRDPWIPEVGRRCDLCGEWVTTIGSPDGLPELELHEGCPKATPGAVDSARRVILALKRAIS